MPALPGYPPVAPRWNIEGEPHDYGVLALHSIVVTRGFRVVTTHNLSGKRERLRPDTVPGASILWSEHDFGRSHLLTWPEGDAVVLVRQDEVEHVDLRVASNDLEAAHKIAAKIDELVSREPASEELVLPVGFWHRGGEGSQITPRRIEVASWSEIAPNYPGETGRHLASLMEGLKPCRNSGRLLLWHGEPGTGKTFAIRALAWAWKDWCRFEYVIDPEALFGCGTYLVDVTLGCFAGHYLFDDNPSKEKWRLLIIEDSGEMMAVDAKNEIGQALSRLLNLSDGILGQGTKILILVTTNEELGRLNPAIRRHGRCLSEIEFRRFTEEESSEWLSKMRCDGASNGRHTLSELYAVRQGLPITQRPGKIGFVSSARV